MREAWDKLAESHRALILGLVIFALGLALRLAGMGWGLPTENRIHALHPDEEVVLAYSQQIQPARLDFTPGFYNYGTLYLTMVKISSDVVMGYGGGPQKEDGSDRVQGIAQLMSTARLLSAIAGAATAWVVFALLRRRTHVVGAVLGGLMVAFAAAFTVHSRFMTVDAVGTLFVALALYWAVRMFPESDAEGQWIPISDTDLRKAALAAGAFAGLAASVKYAGVLAWVAVAVAAGWWLLRRDEERKPWRPAGPVLAATGLSFALTVVVFLAGTPGAILEPEAFQRDFWYEVNHVATGHGLVFAGTAPAAIYHLINLHENFGLILVLGAVAGLIVGLRRESTPWLGGILAFGILTYLSLARAEVKFMRYVFPLIPVLAVGAGWALGELHRKGTNWSRGVVAAGVLAIGGVFGGGLMRALTYTGWMMGVDPRDEVGQLLQRTEVDRTVGIVADPWFWSVSLYPAIHGGPMTGWPYRSENRDAATAPRVLQYVPSNPDQRMKWDERLLTELRPDLVVFTSFETEGYDRLALLAEQNPERVPEAYRSEMERYRAFTKRLTDLYNLEIRYAQDRPAIHDLMYIRPEVWVWRRKDLPVPSLSPTSSDSSTSSATSADPAPTP